MNFFQTPMLEWANVSYDASTVKCSIANIDCTILEPLHARIFECKTQIKLNLVFFIPSIKSRLNSLLKLRIFECETQTNSTPAFCIPHSLKVV